MTDLAPAELFTLPPSPDEVAEARERDEQRTELARSLRAKAVEAWRRVPPTFRATVPELLKRLDLNADAARRRMLAKLRDAHCTAGVLAGPTGCGKTTAAAVLVRRALNDFEQSLGKRCACAIELVWTNAVEIAVAERRHALGAGEPELLGRARTCGLLVLDDVGLEDPGAIFPILSFRYDHCRATIATSGLDRERLRKHLSAAGVRRLVEQHVESPVLFVDCHEKSSPAKNTTGGRP